MQASPPPPRFRDFQRHPGHCLISATAANTLKSVGRVGANGYGDRAGAGRGRVHVPGNSTLGTTTGQAGWNWNRRASGDLMKDGTSRTSKLEGRNGGRMLGCAEWSGRWACAGPIPYHALGWNATKKETLRAGWSYQTWAGVVHPYPSRPLWTKGSSTPPTVGPCTRVGKYDDGCMYVQYVQEAPAFL